MLGESSTIGPLAILQVLLSKRDSECGIVCEDTERLCAGLTAADSRLILVELFGGDIADESF